MIDKIKTILRNKLVNKLALIPMLGSILIIISLFTPFALSKGEEGISISSQSNVWYWGIYQEHDQTFFLKIPIMLPIYVLFFAILILILSIEFGLDNLNRKLYGELTLIFIVLTYLSITLNIVFIEYAFSVMPDLETMLFTHAPFWVYRIQGFGTFWINIAIFLIGLGSFMALNQSRKSFFYIGIIIIVLIWIISSSNFFF